MLELKIADWNKAQGFVKPLRYQVFVIEQKVPEKMEWDEFDENAFHAILLKDEKVIGTGRLILDEPYAKIGRMAIDQLERKKSYGKKILDALIKKAKEKGAQKITLHAQVHAIPFYAQAGFEPTGPIFDEAGIEHVEMYLNI